jgi:MtN3 and saliva related transmembrane protein
MHETRYSELVGFVAGFGTTFAVVPDLLRMLRTRSSKGMSPTMPAILSAFQVVWIYYGVLIGSRPVVMWNVVAVLINSLSVVAYLQFARRERTDVSELTRAGESSDVH